MKIIHCPLNGPRNAHEFVQGPEVKTMPGAEASAGKIWWCERHQALQDLAQELLGAYGQLAKGSPWAVDRGNWHYTFLRSRANSIEGGTTEIQRNILAERVLGLPKD